MIYGIWLLEHWFKYSIRLVYKGLTWKEQKIEIWTEDFNNFAKWLMSLSYVLESPIPPVQLLFLKAKRAAMLTNFSIVRQATIFREL